MYQELFKIIFVKNNMLKLLIDKCFTDPMLLLIAATSNILQDLHFNYLIIVYCKKIRGNFKHLYYYAFWVKSNLG